MPCDCKSVFNRLSQGDRLKLRGAALTKAISGFIRDDTEAYPARYPFYAAYLLIVITPLPFPFASTLTVAATLAWARYSKSEYAERLNSRLKTAFNGTALICNHRAFIEEGPEAGSLRIRNKALAWDATKKSCQDTHRATVHAWNALKRKLFK